MADIFDRKRLAPLKDTVAIVGVGETDYGATTAAPAAKRWPKARRATTRIRWPRAH